MLTTNRRRFLTLASATLAAPVLSCRAFADAWPKDKVIRAVVPFAAGSTIDIIGRVVLDPLSQQLGQAIAVENRGAPAAPSARPRSPNPTPTATRC
jgi:tripartite-type tricarboxylate transporter receptor subunit TctC